LSTDFDPTSGLPVSPIIGDIHKSLATANGWTVGHYYQWNGVQWKDGVYIHNPGDGFPSIGVVDTDGVALWTKYVSFPGIPKTPVFSNVEPSYPSIGDSYLATATTTNWTATHYYVWGNTAAAGLTPVYGWLEGQYNAAYVAANTLWYSNANLSWLETFTIQQASGDLSKLEWFNDRSVFNDQGIATTGTGQYSTAILFLKELIAWITKKKNIVSYSVPIQSSADASKNTVVLDLMTPVLFSDHIYTNDAQMLGWITKIETDTENDCFNISLIFNV
jgi:hypothetical protein